MKKFYCNGKILYLHNNHSSLTAKILLRDVGVAGEHDNVCQALESEQDMLDFCIDFLDVAVKVADPTGKEPEDLDKYFEVASDDPDCYLLPNGKSAPFGLTGTELAAMESDEKVFVVSLSQVYGVLELRKAVLNPEHSLVLVDRDLIFATREKAVQAYNALFGDLYGEI